MKSFINKAREKYKRNQCVNELKKYKAMDIYKYHVEVKLTNGMTYNIGDKYHHTGLSYWDWIKEMLHREIIKTDEGIIVTTAYIIESRLINTDTIENFHHYIDTWRDYRSYFPDDFIEESSQEYDELYKEVKACGE